MKLNKRGQIAIWVILAILIIVGIILLFLTRGKLIPEAEEKVEEDPRGYIDNCVRKNVNDAIDIMLPQGGAIKPEHSKLYKNINVSYLCYNRGNYYPCVNEHPLLIKEMSEEIKIYIEPRVEQCFEDYKREMNKRNVEVSLEPMTIGVELAPERVYVDIDRKVSISQKGESYSLNEFNIEIINPVYNLARVAMEIASQEAEYCYFEYVGYMILYPEFKINLDTMSDSTKIYIIKDKKSSKEINIAIRSCAIPPGL